MYKYHPFHGFVPAKDQDENAEEPAMKTIDQLEYKYVPYVGMMHNAHCTYLIMTNVRLTFSYVLTYFLYILTKLMYVYRIRTRNRGRRYN